MHVDVPRGTTSVVCAFPSKWITSGWRVDSQCSFPMLVLALELVVTRDMTLNKVGRDALAVPEELVRQSGAGKVGLRLRNDRLFRPSVHGDQQFTRSESNLDRAGALEIQPLVNARIFRQCLGSDLHR